MICESVDIHIAGFYCFSILNIIIMGDLLNFGYLSHLLQHFQIICLTPLLSCEHVTLQIAVSVFQSVRT